MNVNMLKRWNYWLKLKVLTWAREAEEKDRQRYQEYLEFKDVSTKKLMRDFLWQLLTTALLSFALVALIWNIIILFF